MTAPSVAGRCRCGGARLAAAALVAAALLAAAPLAAAPADASSRRCHQAKGKNEPPCNPALPNSPWGVSHRNSYAQASSPRPGLVPGDRVRPEHIELPGVPISLLFTDRYRDGGRAVWGSLISSTDERAVFKVDHQTGKLIDLYIPAEREASPPPPEPGGVTGAYNILDRSGRFYVPRQRSIDVYADAGRGKGGSRSRPGRGARLSPIRLVKRFVPPAGAFCRPDDVFVGATMTYDGKIAFATEQGNVGIVPRKPSRMTAERVRALSLNGDRCADPSVPSGDLEQVSNSIAADERGGIYVVTSERMHKVRWRKGAGPRSEGRGRVLSRGWSADYESGKGGDAGIRLGEGSGSTPSVMGTGKQRDRLVVITDGRDLMHLVLLWRGRIPRGWKPIAPGKNRRIACEVPVQFGDPEATASVSEQSVLVSGYATVHAQNLLRDLSVLGDATGVLRNALAALYGGDPAVAPHGVERIDWDRRRNRCRRVWSNPRPSIPNGIPTMSRDTGLLYGISQRNGSWGVRGLDFDTGRGRLLAPAPAAPCSESALAGLPDVARAALQSTLEQLPNSCENSVYAATEVGPNKTIYTGTFLGMTIYRTVKGRDR